MARSDRLSFQSKMSAMAEDLRSKIKSGEYAKGQYLPPELILTKQYALSKKSVRLVLQRLTDEGLISKQPRVGTIVNGFPDKTTIRFGIYPSMNSETDIHTLIHQFHNQHPDIHIEPIELPYSNVESIKTMIRLGIVDVVTLNLMDWYQWRPEEHDWLTEQPLAEEVPDFLRHPFMETPTARLTVQPFVYSPVILCYNKQHWQEKSLPEPESGWHWEQLFNVLRELRAPNRYAFAFQLFSINRWPLFFLQHPDFPDSASLQGITRLRSFIHEKGMFPLALAQGEFEAENLFREQKVSAILTTYYRLNDLRESNVLFDIAPLPAWANGNTLLLVTGLAISRASVHQEQASKLVSFLMSEQSQSHIRQNTFTLPAHQLAAQKPVLLKNLPAKLNLYQTYRNQYKTYGDLGYPIQQLFQLSNQLKLYAIGLMEEEQWLAIPSMQENLEHV
ncbi:extracellular solute-binding protein [Paenibacillus senegalensis]|uniref:extracellular solute-binding protein n=1 Tax=Paenibacillus senegalensis TaxID=1465766 RepID=UPI0002889319|nr:extracellular solute-binding protein [Paenibacillus senegalensis]